MGLGRQRASRGMLEHFLTWADAAGFRILEHPDYGGVHPVHVAGSWHYDGLAADLNYGPPGAPAIERVKATYAIEVAESMGLGLIYARDGASGSAATHRDHLHVDCGPTSNYGRGLVNARSGDRKVQRVQRELHFPMARRDNLWGEDTDARFEAVRAASRYRGGKFPHTKKTAQRAVGAKADGVWGAKSRAAHDHTVAELQEILGVARDGVWGPATDRAYLAMRKDKKR